MNGINTAPGEVIDVSCAHSKDDDLLETRLLIVLLKRNIV
jgi:hypothetical protein